MMREIKFRGLSDRGWVYGHLTGLEDSVYIDVAQTRDDGGNVGHIENYLETVEVKPHTVGQYTGLKDKNGKEIYEGDFRQWNFEGIERVYEVYYDDFHAAFKCKLVKYSDKYDPSIDEFERDFHKRMIREGACSHIIRDRWSKLIGNIYETIKEGKE